MDDVRILTIDSDIATLEDSKPSKDAVLNLIQNSALFAIPSIFETRKYDSFVTEKITDHSILLADGKETFLAMYIALMDAKEEIFITDWFLSPEIYLVRQDENGESLLLEEHRLDNVLKKKADEGVKIYIQIWDETTLGFALNSLRVQIELDGYNDNIHVIRHPFTVPVTWSHHQKIIVVDQKIAFVGGIDLCFGRYDDNFHKLIDQDSKTWRGKDYYNQNIEALTDLDKPFIDLIDRKTQPRCPWHDTSVEIFGLAARDVGINFIDRWNFSLRELYMIGPRISVKPVESTVEVGKQRVQILRSVSEWSSGLKTEFSIYNAYLDLIENSKHFIYIENQFFISSVFGEPNFPIKNKIAKVIVERIRRAIRENQVYRIIVILPEHVEGDYKAMLTRQICYWQYKTIYGKGSIIHTLKCEFPEVDISQYITFHSLRNYGLLENDVCTTEQIYVHSKLMIVDDDKVICGSANINDRSMLGFKDSEIAMVMTDVEKIYVTMNGTKILVSPTVHEYRLKLFREHLGFGDNDNSVFDFLSDEFYNNTWRKHSKLNSQLFKQVFPTIHSDEVSFMETLQKVCPRTVDFKLLDKVQGHLTDFSEDIFIKVDRFDQIIGQLSVEIFI